MMRLELFFCFQNLRKEDFFNDFYFAGAKILRGVPAKLNGVRKDYNKNQFIKKSHFPPKARGEGATKGTPHFE